MRKFLLFVLTVVAIFSAPALYAETFNCKFQQTLPSGLENPLYFSNRSEYLYCGEKGTDGCAVGTIVVFGDGFHKCEAKQEGSRHLDWTRIDVEQIQNCGQSVTKEQFPIYMKNFKSAKYNDYVFFYKTESDSSRAIINKCKIKKETMQTNCDTSGGKWDGQTFECTGCKSGHKNNRNMFPCVTTKQKKLNKTPSPKSNTSQTNTITNNTPVNQSDMPIKGRLSDIKLCNIINENWELIYEDTPCIFVNKQNVEQEDGLYVVPTFNEYDAANKMCFAPKSECDKYKAMLVSQPESLSSNNSGYKNVQLYTVDISKISGKVLYDGKPVKDATVIIDGRSRTQTNKKGQFEFKNINDITVGGDTPTKLKLIAKYQNNTAEQIIDITEAETEYIVDITITPTPITISGKIYDSQDPSTTLKQDVTIKYTTAGGGQTQTVSNGEFTLTDVPTSTVVFSASGYNDTTRDCKTSNDCKTVIMVNNSASTESTNISGEIRDKSDNLFTRTVSITYAEKQNAKTISVSDGKFNITADKDSTITFTADGCETTKCKVADGCNKVIMSESANFTTQIVGTVKDGNNGLKDVTVSISTDSRTATTDKSGAFKLDNVAVKLGEGNTILTFATEGYETLTYPVDVQEAHKTTAIKGINVIMQPKAKEEGVEEETEIVQTDPDQEQIKKAEEAEAKYKAAAEKEKAGRAHSAIATGLSTAGGYMLGASIAERIADNDAEEAMNSYLGGMRCSYAGGQNVELGQTVEIPGGDELFNYYNKYKQIAERLKRTKAALNLPAGIESQVVYDKAETNLYKYTTLGTRSSGEISLARALTDPNSEDAAAWAAQKEKTNTNMTIGGSLATGGLATGIIGRIAVNNKYDDDDDESEE